MALLTRIVTVYQQWSFLEHWLGDDALFAPEVAWMVVNDAPWAPCPPELLRRLEARGFRIVSPPANLGRCGARNRGASLAETAWIECIDGDDIPLPWDPRDLAGVSERVAACYYPHATHSLEDGERRTHEPYDPEQIHHELAFLFERWQPINARPACLLWRRDLFLDIGGYDARFEMIEDFDLARRADHAGGELLSFRKPKQSYLLELEGRPDLGVAPLGRMRFFGAVERGASPEAVELARQHAGGFAAKTIWAATRVLDGYAQLPATLRAERTVFGTRPEEDLFPLYHEMRRLLFRLQPPSLVQRLREALKLLLGR